MTQRGPGLVLGGPAATPERLALHVCPWVTPALSLAGLSELIHLVFISYVITIWLHFYQDKSPRIGDAKSVNLYLPILDSLSLYLIYGCSLLVAF